jgi:hypothetical protein
MLFRRSPYDRQILALAVPALGALAAEPLYVLVDTAIVGHLGTRQLAALAIAATLLSTAFTVFNFLTYGTPRRSRGCTEPGATRPRRGSARRRCGSASGSASSSRCCSSRSPARR